MFFVYTFYVISRFINQLQGCQYLNNYLYVNHGFTKRFRYKTIDAPFARGGGGTFQLVDRQWLFPAIGTQVCSQRLVEKLGPWGLFQCKDLSCNGGGGGGRDAREMDQTVVRGEEKREGSGGDGFGFAAPSSVGSDCIRRACKIPTPPALA